MLPSNEPFPHGELALLEFIQGRLLELESQLATLRPWAELQAISDEVTKYLIIVETMECNHARGMN
jgi:hypothetical protein